ncbi:uncharacterized protein LOC131948107 [Physella acuta]|uniref:uncharacterized protein LOC131948107 n=1 Tax=Physella acuta TaxID=109671 RepID=UPI0027DC5F50|nr:uncharacterized protein LOC131948107 [Physella acuta]XP_059165607.1 uncharacterized protein LOC131948107 [Physella acuta]
MKPSQIPQSNRKSLRIKNKESESLLESAPVQNKKQKVSLKSSKGLPKEEITNTTFGDTVGKRKVASKSKSFQLSLSSGQQRAESKTKHLDENFLLDIYHKRLRTLKGMMGFTEDIQVFHTLCDRFEKLRDTTKAVGMCKYMRNQFEYFGIPTPQRRDVYKNLWKDVRLLNSSELRTLACQTWFSPEREFQYFTAELLEREVLRIYSDDNQSPENTVLKALDFVKTFLLHEKSWWDTVDTLAPKVVGQLYKQSPDVVGPVLDQWNVDRNRWLCRTSIIFQLGYKADTDAERLFRYCLKVGNEEEFFIQKGMGWALREYHKTDPEAVRNFVLKNKSKLSALSIREALKHDK